MTSMLAWRFFSTSLNNIPLTESLLPHLARGNFERLTSQDISYFESVIPGGVLTDPDDTAVYNQDWLEKYRGSCPAVLRPKTVEQVSRILKYCNEKRLAVNPQGGNTGLVGGSVPVFDEIVLSTSLMNRIEGLDEISGILTCQAGCILENLDDFLQQNGFIMPLDLGAKGSCQIGGNIATNAGGLRLLRYGSLHGSILGLEAVLSDGTIVNTLSGCRKDNTGYDIKQIFIGSEGTLGVITRASILVPRKPSSVAVAFLGLDSYKAVQNVFVEAKSQLGEILSACEFLDSESMRLVNTYLGYENPLGNSYPFFMLIETHGSCSDHDEEKLNNFLSNAMERGMLQDGTIATDTSKMEALWGIREGITESLKKEGFVYKYDISLPVSKLYDIVEDMRSRLGSRALTCCGYGHIGDGNLHLNITTEGYSQNTLELIEPFVYEWTSDVCGSISAEHGLGVMKPQHMHYSKSSSAIDVMRSMKKLLDPKGILNPYKTVI